MASSAVASKTKDDDPRHMDENHPYDGSGLAQRQCTDVFCLVVFLLYLAGMGAITVFAVRNGNLERLTHGFSYRGELCGVDKEVLHQPHIYWCGAGRVLPSGFPSALDLKFPTCVAECPTDTSMDMACLGLEQVQVDTAGTPPYVTVKTTITQTTVKQKSYPTVSLGGLYCVPHMGAGDLPMADALTKSLLGLNGPAGDIWFRIIDAMGSAKRAWQVILGSVLLSTVLGYVFLFLVKTFAKPLVEVSLLLLTACLLLSGCFLMVGFLLSGDILLKWEEFNVLFKQFEPETAAHVSQVLGIILSVAGIVTFCIVCLAKQSIMTSVGCVEAACECVFAMPSLLMQPTLEAGSKLAIGSGLLLGLMWLLSTVEMKPDFVQVHNQSVGGLTHNLVFNDEQRLYVGFYAFGIVWLLELCSAMAHFVVSYSVVTWYYTPKPKGAGGCLPLVRGFLVGLVFHLGTLAMGSLLISTTRVVRFILGLVSRGEKDGNPLLHAVAACLFCCMSFFEKYLEFLNNNAYIDVCISSTNFCTASKNSFNFLAAESGKVLLLNGACMIISVAGVLTISAVTGLVTFVVVTSNAHWASETSPDYVANPLFVAGLASAMAAYIAVSFMVVFDHAADTLLYTYVWNKSHGHNTVIKYAPETLMRLVDYQAKSKDRAFMEVSPEMQSRGVLSTLSSFFAQGVGTGSQRQLHEETQRLVH